MSVDQAFHTPSFGDEEFEFPTLGPNGRCGARGVFGNQVPVEYLKRKLSCDQIYVYFPKRDNNQADCQIYNNHSLSNQPLLHQQGYPSHASAMSGNNQYHHQSGEAYQQDMMHSINMQLQSFDNHSTYLSNGSVQQAPMQRPQVTMMPQSQLMGPPQQIFSTISQSQMSSQLGLQIGMGQTPHHQGAGSIGSSPPGSNHNSPGLETSEDSDDSTPLAQLIGTMKRPSPEPLDTSIALTKATKKPKAQKKKKKRDPNEPQKPVSAYALFFRDTQAAIKGQNPNASFGEVSKIVASMWDALDVDHKNGYKKRTETAKKEYLKALAAYRATLVSKAAVDQSDAIYGNSPPNQNSPTNSIDRMMQKVSPVLTSVVDAIQPVANAMGLHQRPAVHNQQAWHMQSPPHMSNSNSSPPQMMQSNAMMQQQQMVMNSSGSHQMAAHSPQMGHSPSDSPTYGQNTLSAPSGGSMLSTSADAMQQCLRNGCSNPAINNPDWDREYCSSECVVSHCKDVFATWVAERQGIPTAYSTVK